MNLSFAQVVGAHPCSLNLSGLFFVWKITCCYKRVVVSKELRNLKDGMEYLFWDLTETLLQVVLAVWSFLWVQTELYPALALYRGLFAVWKTAFIGCFFTPWVNCLMFVKSNRFLYSSSKFIWRIRAAIVCEVYVDIMPFPALKTIQMFILSSYKHSQEMTSATACCTVSWRVKSSACYVREPRKGGQTLWSLLICVQLLISHRVTPRGKQGKSFKFSNTKRKILNSLGVQSSDLTWTHGPRAQWSC